MVGWGDGQRVGGQKTSKKYFDAGRGYGGAAERIYPRLLDEAVSKNSAGFSENVHIIFTIKARLFFKVEHTVTHLLVPLVKFESSFRRHALCTVGMS